ncbi:MAG: hypothetical protein V3S64_06350, partial [bacterium]
METVVSSRIYPPGLGDSCGGKNGGVEGQGDDFIIIEGSISRIAGNKNFTLSNPNFIGINHTVGDDLAFFPLVPDFHTAVD